MLSTNVWKALSYNERPWLTLCLFTPYLSYSLSCAPDTWLLPLQDSPTHFHTNPIKPVVVHKGLTVGVVLSGNLPRSDDHLRWSPDWQDGWMEKLGTARDAASRRNSAHPRMQLLHETASQNEDGNKTVHSKWCNKNRKISESAISIMNDHQCLNLVANQQLPAVNCGWKLPSFCFSRTEWCKEEVTLPGWHTVISSDRGTPQLCVCVCCVCVCVCVCVCAVCAVCVCVYFPKSLSQWGSRKAAWPHRALRDMMADHT